MIKTFVKNLLGLCLIGQLALGQILLPLDRKRPIDPPVDSCQERLVCQSNNDPHMVNFWNQPFEYQYEVTDQCLHRTKDVEVSGSFNQCPSPWLNAKCNCGVKIKVGSSQQTASIDNCSNNGVFDTNVVTFYSIYSRPFRVTCQTVTNTLFNPLDESDWALLPVTTGNPFYLCAIFNGHTYIKTRLPTPNDNVIVEIFPGMSSLYVHASKSYTASPTIDGECLCENKKDPLTEHLRNLAEEMPEEIEKCKSVLLNDCFRNLLQFENFLSQKRVQEFDKLIANCALDIKAGEVKGDFGAFQQNEIQNQINTAILEAFANPENEKIIAEYCDCQSNNDPKHVEICQRLNIKF